MAAANFTAAESFQAYALKFKNELISETFFGGETASLITGHDDVKTDLPLTELILADLVYKWRGQFDENDDLATFTPRILKTYLAKVDLPIYPQAFESSYLAAARKKGQNPKDLPFERFILDKVLKKIQQEIETSRWQAAIPASPTATDKLALLYDGFLEIIKDEITATNITATATGALTNTNAVASVEAMYANLGSAYQAGEVDIFMSLANRINFMQDYRTRYKASAGEMTADGRLRLDIGEAYLHGVPGMGSSGRVVMTPAANLHYGYDGLNDEKTIRFDMDKRQLCMMVDFRIGAQIGIVSDDILVVNDQT